MSLVKIQGNASGTGEFTIAAPNSNTNRTLTLPDATGTFITTAGGAAISGTTGSFSSDLSFNSGYGSAAVAYGCRAWVNFNGTGTPAIRASGNVSSITDNGTGDYTVNFTTAMPDANFATVASVRREAAFSNPPTVAIDQYGGTSRPNTTTTTTVMCGDQSGLRDSSLVLVSVHR
jgi:hypothetical protein